MLQFLFEKLPRELVVEIALFDGRIFRAYLRDYISEIYARVYKQFFGHRYSLKVICGLITPEVDQMAALPFYTAWSTMIRKRDPSFVKQRKPRSNMRPYVGIISKQRLIRERRKIEKALAHFFAPKTGGITYRGLIQVSDHT